jgi:hypothetical protein
MNAWVMLRRRYKMSIEKCISLLFDESVEKDDIGDVSTVVYNRYSISKLERFVISGDVFFDNIVVWCTYNVGNIRECHDHVRSILTSIGLSKFAVSYLNSGKSTDNDIIEIGTSYVSFKVSLSNEDPEQLVRNLKKGNSVLRSSQIFLRDIDVTADCFGSTTREHVKKYIVENGIASEEHIVKDRNKVGNNCISWYMTSGSGVRLRIKVYNKFVQMLESAEVRSYIGSRLSSIVADPSKRFRDVLKECKNHGLTRIEIKVYSQDIYGIESYIGIMYNLLDVLDKCTVYSTSFEDQWKALVDEIHNKKVLMVYIRDSKTFSYCHWYNSLTRRRQGITKGNVEAKDIENLIANYSFNERVTKYIEMDSDGSERTEQLFSRVQRNITLVPGPKGSLYPSIEDIDQSILSSFEDMGLVDYKGMNIGWPRRITRSSRPLSVMDRLEKDDRAENAMERINNPNRVAYRVSHCVLSPDSIYKIVAVGRRDYHSQPAVFLRVVDENRNETKVRCGSILFRLISPIVDTITETFYIKTGSRVRSNGHVVDIEASFTDGF